MVRFRDPELFPNDLIAEYYQAVAPPGYAALYWALVWLAEPLLVSKLVPIGLALIAAGFTFLLVRRLHPAPVCAFLASLLAVWYAWQYADLASGTPRAFQLPLLAAQLWALTSGRLAVATAIAPLAALLYPSAGVLAVAVMGAHLLRLRRWRPTLSSRRADWLACLVAGLLAGGLLLAFQQRAAIYGPTPTAAQAGEMAEFRQNGRAAFFDRNPYRYWIADSYSGLDLWAVDRVFGVPIFWVYLALAGLLPLLLLVGRRSAVVRALSGRSIVLLQLLGASFALFFLAHALLFQLYLPSRFVKFSLPLVFAVAAGLAIGMLVGLLGARLAGQRAHAVVSALALGLALLLMLYPSGDPTQFLGDPRPRVTAYLRSQPKDILVAGPSRDSDRVPTFAARRVLTSREYANPYHLGFYSELRQRTGDLVDAYYTRSPNQLAEFIRRYRVDILLVNRATFDPATALDHWSPKFEPFSSRVESKLRNPAGFILPNLAAACAAVDDGLVLVVPTECLLEKLGAGS
jgi:hypothetical protein